MIMKRLQAALDRFPVEDLEESLQADYLGLSRSSQRTIRQLMKQGRERNPDSTASELYEAAKYRLAKAEAGASGDGGDERPCYAPRAPRKD